ncbi:conserved hypothetical protein [Rhodococcus jostii RHA1]|uniref:O-methyltransferase n=2 Tax=Nocardiaceae TaxID=85025 RepID=Q0SAU9_RHOJR|nr:conserved hypothetical protein [Rhodococcus jostii RHA1]
MRYRISPHWEAEPGNVDGQVAHPNAAPQTPHRGRGRHSARRASDQIARPVATHRDRRRRHHRRRRLLTRRLGRAFRHRPGRADLVPDRRHHGRFSPTTPAERSSPSLKDCRPATGGSATPTSGGCRSTCPRWPRCAGNCCRTSRTSPHSPCPLDRSWMDHVDTGRAVFVSAEGLLMHLPADESLSLIGDCARRFPGGRMMFDSVPKWFSRRTQKGMRIHGDYTVPPMPFHLSAGDAADLPGQVPDLAFTREVTLPLGRGLWGSTLLRRLSELRPLRNSRPTLTLCGFAG